MLLEDARRIERERREQEDAERYIKLEKDKNKGEDEKNDNLHKLDLFKNKKNRK